MMKRVAISVLLVATALLAMGPAPASAGERLRARLQGFQEPPAISTGARGEFRAKIDGDEIEYELSYSGLEGTVTQAHIHLGQVGVNGGISVWLCGTPTNPGPAGTPTCPGPNSGTVTRTVSAANVIGPAGQGIAAGEFEELLAAIRAGVTYANVHSTMWPGGEIRGQIRARSDDD